MIDPPQWNDGGMTVSLRSALDDFALLAMEGQDLLASQPGIDGPWEVELDVPMIQIGQLRFSATFIGSSSEHDNSWLWGWSNQAFGPEHQAVAPMLVGRERAIRIGVKEFASRKFSLDGVTDYGMRPGSAVAFLAARLAGLTAIYSAPYVGGVAYIGIRGLELPPPNPVSFPRLAGRAVGFSGNHRQTIGQYAQQRGLAPRVTAEGGIELTFPARNQLTCRFDEANRLVGISGQLGG